MLISFTSLLSTKNFEFTFQLHEIFLDKERTFLKIFLCARTNHILLLIFVLFFFFFFGRFIKFFLSFCIFRIFNNIITIFQGFYFIFLGNSFSFHILRNIFWKRNEKFSYFIFKVFPTKLWIFYIILILIIKYIFNERFYLLNFQRPLPRWKIFKSHK